VRVNIDKTGKITPDSPREWSVAEPGIDKACFWAMDHAELYQAARDAPFHYHVLRSMKM
jgi:hypothetical protein